MGAAPCCILRRKHGGNDWGQNAAAAILQGGMGVGVSLDGLAGTVAACGGMGTISTAMCGFAEPDFETNPFEANLRALARQVRRAKEMANGAGLVAVNAMVATTQYADSVRTALRAGAGCHRLRRGSASGPARVGGGGVGESRRAGTHRQQRPGGGSHL